jgi:hypothetical protein
LWFWFHRLPFSVQLVAVGGVLFDVDVPLPHMQGAASDLAIVCVPSQ